MFIVIFIQCDPQVLFDVLWVCQLSLCVAVAAQDAKLETAIQVLPLVRWNVHTASYLQHVHASKYSTLLLVFVPSKFEPGGGGRGVLSYIGCIGMAAV